MFLIRGIWSFCIFVKFKFVSFLSLSSRSPFLGVEMLYFFHLRENFCSSSFSRRYHQTAILLFFLLWLFFSSPSSDVILDMDDISFDAFVGRKEAVFLVFLFWRPF